MSLSKLVCRAWLAVALCLAGPATGVAYTLDTSALLGPVTGLWWNPNESGWGVTFTQEYEKIFVALYTYDTSGNAIWYVATDCPVSGAGCSGPLYKVGGGVRLTVPWSAPGLTVTSVGSLSVSFSDANNGTMSFTINGEPGAKTITRQIFASGTSAGVQAYQGNYTGTYTGLDNGTFTVAINSTGQIAGSYFSAQYSQTGPVTGSISPTGALTMSTSGVAGSATFSGTSTTAGAVSGTWVFVGTASGGTFVGQRH